MRPLLLAALCGLFILGISGCSGSVAIQSSTPPPNEPVPPIVIDSWPVAEPLTGDFPVGRWMCLPAVDFGSMRNSNSALFPDPCNVLRFEKSPAAELRADGTGRSLNIHRRPS